MCPRWPAAFLVVAVVACTSEPAANGRASSPPPESAGEIAPTPNGSETSRPVGAAAAPTCQAPQAVDYDTGQQDPTPERALSKFGDGADPSDFTAVVDRRGVLFVANDRTVAYRVAPVRATKWAVVARTNPGCLPRSARRALAADAKDLACRREHAVLFKMAVTTRSELVAVRRFITRRISPRLQLPRGVYVEIERTRRQTIYGHAHSRGLRATLEVTHFSSGSGVSSASWC